MSKHTLTINYSGEQDTQAIIMSILNFLFTPYKKGKKYKYSEEVNEKLPILEALLYPYHKEVIDKFLELVNKDIDGLANLVTEITNELEKQTNQKYRISFDIEKLGE